MFSVSHHHDQIRLALICSRQDFGCRISLTDDAFNIPGTVWTSTQPRAYLGMTSVEISRSETLLATRSALLLKVNRSA